MKHAIPLLVLTAACGQSATPGALAPALDVPRNVSFPTFEPFESFAGEAASVAKIEVAMHEVQASAEANEDPWMSSGTCVLPSPITREQRMVAWLIPSALRQLEPLWHASPWSTAQVEDARAVARILMPLPDAPRPEFAVEDPERNQAGLAAMSWWFQTRVEVPEWYAAMLEQHVIDYGPYVGLPCDPAERLITRGARPIDDRTEFRLHQTERTALWVFQVVRDETPLWTRLACPARSDVALQFPDNAADTVQSLGTYGWRVTLVCSEDCEIYLDEGGQLLFYFVGF